MIRYTCPHCGEPVVTASADAGHEHVCPSCGQSATVPAEERTATQPTNRTHTTSRAAPVTETTIIYEEPAPAAYVAGEAAGCLSSLACSGCLGCLVPLLAGLVGLLVCCVRLLGGGGQ